MRRTHADIAPIGLGTFTGMIALGGVSIGLAIASLIDGQAGTSLIGFAGGAVGWGYPTFRVWEAGRPE